MRLLSPILLLVIFNFPRFAISWSLLWVVVTSVLSVIVRVVTDSPFPFETFQRTSLWIVYDSNMLYYFRTDQHIVGYILGILCAYLIRNYPNVNLGDRIGELTVWISTWFITFVAMYWANQFWLYDYHITYTEILWYLGISKLMYLCGWFWLVYACSTGRAGNPCSNTLLHLNSIASFNKGV